MTVSIQYEYDVALSYASEDVAYVEAVAEALRRQSIKVFFDRFQDIEIDLLGRNLVDELSKVYQYKARLCVLFISHAYSRKPYTRLERQAAQARVIEENGDTPYIIPVRIDETPIPGLFSTVVYAPAKLPESLAATIAAKLRSFETAGHKLAGLGRSDAVLVRFNTLLDFDHETFESTLQRVSHWAPGAIAEVAIEVRLPAELEVAGTLARSFRQSEAWQSSAIGESAHRQWDQIQNELGPALLDGLASGVRLLLRRYRNYPDRLRTVIRLWTLSAVVSRCRLLDASRLIGQPPYSWSASFAHFAAEWSQSILNGLTYISSTDGDEQFFWIDADLWHDREMLGRRYRVFLPSSLCLDPRTGARREPKIDQAAFDKFVACQLVEAHLNDENESAFPWTAVDHSTDMTISLRGEVAFETDHFSRTVVSNFDGESLVGSVRRLRKHILATAAGAEVDASRRKLYLVGLHGLLGTTDGLRRAALDE